MSQAQDADGVDVGCPRRLFVAPVARVQGASEHTPVSAGFRVHRPRRVTSPGARPYLGVLALGWILATLPPAAALLTASWRTMTDKWSQVRSQFWAQFLGALAESSIPSAGLGTIGTRNFSVAFRSRRDQFCS